MGLSQVMTVFPKDHQNYLRAQFCMLARVSLIISGQFLASAERKSTLCISKLAKHITNVKLNASFFTFGIKR